MSKAKVQPSLKPKLSVFVVALTRSDAPTASGSRFGLDAMDCAIISAYRVCADSADAEPSEDERADAADGRRALAPPAAGDPRAQAPSSVDDGRQRYSSTLPSEYETAPMPFASAKAVAAFVGFRAQLTA